MKRDSMTAEKEKGFWDHLETWEKEWEKKRREERIEDARKLMDAQKEYERSLNSLNPLKPQPDPKKILSSESREPGLSRVPLKDPVHYHMIMPVGIRAIEHTDAREAVIFLDESQGETKDLLEKIAFQIKRLVEYMMDERFLFVLKPEDRDAIVFKISWAKDSLPVIGVFSGQPHVIRVKVLEKALGWSPGYIFDMEEVLKFIVQRLKREVEGL